MKIIAKREDDEIAYIQNRDIAFIRQFITNQVEYKNRNGDFIEITDPVFVEQIKNMDYILDYCELMSLTQEQLDERYDMIKILYNARNTYHSQNVYRIDDIQDLYSEKEINPKSTYDIATDSLFYALEQLREFTLIRQGKANLVIPAVMVEDEFKFSSLKDYLIHGTTDPKTIIMTHIRGEEICFEDIDLAHLKIAIWLNYIRVNNLADKECFDANKLNIQFELSEDRRCLKIKYETKKEDTFSLEQQSLKKDKRKLKIRKKLPNKKEKI